MCDHEPFNAMLEKVNSSKFKCRRSNCLHNNYQLAYDLATNQTDQKVLSKTIKCNITNENTKRKNEFIKSLFSEKS
uniref:Uncharacterized protein n=1 Tax=viral metagenome TaxID=1070528 RepID=A0A6C0J894_9ZZZZ